MCPQRHIAKCSRSTIARSDRDRASPVLHDQPGKRQASAASVTCDAWGGIQGDRRTLPVTRSGSAEHCRRWPSGVLAAPTPAFAQAEVTLPEVRVIGTTPLSTVRTRAVPPPARPSPRRARSHDTCSRRACAAGRRVGAGRSRPDRPLQGAVEYRDLDGRGFRPRQDHRAWRTRCCSTCRASTSTTPR